MEFKTAYLYQFVVPIIMCRKASYNQNGQKHSCDPLHRFNSLLHGRKFIKIILIVVVICGMTSLPLYFKLKDTSIRIDKILSTNWAQMYWNPRPTEKPNRVSFKFLKQGYQYHKLRETFSKFYRRYYDMISKFQVGLKSPLRQGLSEPDFYGDLMYQLKKIVGSYNFSAQFIKIISHYKKIGYNINVLQQTACLVVNQITTGNYAFLFNCTPVGRSSDSMMVPT